ncbi:cuticle protein LPCP-23-like [Toxorhynchites rutilus septentrionalis]|uniref:cuticle protein LPCP-23-like n=1 Tax=Toxorhynchites rutilus septentrionalis TaxID=329112 RepID=UPI002479E6EF|nr:cuticle protein LPCP-23-like [Toxorhynchites rutilus septentrionalis]
MDRLFHINIKPTNLNRIIPPVSFNLIKSSASKTVPIMAFKMVALFASLAYASAGYIEADNHHAPLAHYSSAPAVSYSTFTRGLPSPKVEVAKTVSYAEPSVHYAAAPLTKSYAVHEPSLLKTSIVAQPAYTKTIVQQPTYAKTVIPEPVYAHAAPVVAHHQPLSYSAPVAYSAPIVKNVEYAKTFVSQPAYTHSVVAEPTYAKTILSEPVYHKTVVQQPALAKTFVSEPVYTHAAPVVATKTLSYSPAHVSYDGSSAHHAW